MTPDNLRKDTPYTGGVPEVQRYDTRAWRTTPIWLWFVTIGMLVALVVMQRPEPETPSTDAARGLGEIKAPESSGFHLIVKLGLAIKGVLGNTPTPPGQDPVQQIQQFADSFAGWTGSNKFQPPSATNPPAETKHPMPAEDRLRAAMTAGVLGLSKEEVQWRVDNVEQTLAPESVLKEDVRTVRSLFDLNAPSDRATDEGAAFEDRDPAKPATSADATEEAKASLISRHGLIARLAIEKDDPQSAAHASASSQGMLALVLVMIVMTIVGVALLTGLVLLIVALVRFFSRDPARRWRFVRPNPATEWPNDPSRPEEHVAGPALARPGSVWLETVAVFLGGFLLVKIVTWLLATQTSIGDEALTYLGLGLQWALLVTIFWPLVRGMSFSRWCADMGWHRGRGVAREIGAGIAGYLAGLPLYILMAMVVVVLMMLWSLIKTALGGEESPPPSNKITELVEGGGPLVLLMIYLLATVWAPVVEESIFRGALFRHLRRRTGLILSALVSAAVFAVLHGYIVAGLLMVGTLGFWFALMREWRGSIIPCVTGHAIHNGFVLAMIIMFSTLMKG